MLNAKKILQILRDDGYHSAASLIEKMRSVIDRDTELNSIIEYVDDNPIDGDGYELDQLRSLWTAYCLHQNLVVDTFGYDRDMQAVWNHISKSTGNGVVWKNFEDFDNFMCRFLV